MEQFLQVGVISSTHGLRGEVKVFPTTDDAARFQTLKEVILDTGKEKLDLEIQSVRFFKQFVIVKFKGIDDINDIEKYKGKKILVEGRLQTRSYVDKQNVTRWVTELVGRHFEYMYSNPSPQQKFDEEFENPFEGVPMPDMDNIPF